MMAYLVYKLIVFLLMSFIATASMAWQVDSECNLKHISSEDVKITLHSERMDVIMPLDVIDDILFIYIDESHVDVEWHYIGMPARFHGIFKDHELLAKGKTLTFHTNWDDYPVSLVGSYVAVFEYENCMKSSSNQ